MSAPNRSLIVCAILSTIVGPIATASDTEIPRVNPLAVVQFASGSADVAEGARDALGVTLSWLAAHPKRIVYVEGYADRRGGSSSNLDLSYQRSQAVRDELVRRGADPFRIIAVAHGEDRDLGSVSPMREVVISGSDHAYAELLDAQRLPTPPPARRPPPERPSRPSA
ncbi:MAG: OmpA family protein [Kofleriaceae bacterium]|nr:OmpA family protein [Kofleriaceae bacterium]